MLRFTRMTNLIGQECNREIDSYWQIHLNQIFFKNGNAPTRIVTFMCAGPYLLTLDNCFFHMDAGHNIAIYLRFTAVVFSLLSGS